MYRMVIVDDEYFTCEGLKILLDWEKMNIEIVGTASNGEDGLQLIEKEKPDLIITDIMMNNMDGLTMIKKLRSGGFKGGVIILSGYKVFEYVQEAMGYAVSSYLLKPITKDKMIEAVNIVLKKLNETRQGKDFQNEEVFDTEETWTKVMKYINDNITGNITLTKVAGVACLETSYFSRLFKKKMKMGFLEYILQQRMEIAKRLLKETDLQVKEIMYKLSYNDEKYFRSIFKSYTGYSPTEYRKMCLETGSDENKE